MTFGLRVLPAADADVDQLARYIAYDSVDQALRFYDAVNVTYKTIIEAPRRWALYGFKTPPAEGHSEACHRGFFKPPRLLSD